jgi:hypothetical protein
MLSQGTCVDQHDVFALIPGGMGLTSMECFASNCTIQFSQPCFLHSIIMEMLYILQTFQIAKLLRITPTVICAITVLYFHSVTLTPTVLINHFRSVDAIVE